MRRTAVTALSWTAFILAVYVFLGMRPAPPQTIAEGEVCFNCRRVVADARLAAEIIDGALPTKYRTAGCMAGYVARHPSRDSRYFVTDFASGGLIPAEHAHYVPVLINDRTGEHDYRAYYSRRLAEIAAVRLGVVMVEWSTVVERAGRV